jgi:hypothetical protein
MMSLFPRRAERRAARALAEAERLRTAGRSLEAIDLLTTANRDSPSPEIERRLVDFRHSAFAELDRKATAPKQPTAPSLDEHLDSDGVPVIEAEALDAELLRKAIFGHGCLLVRGLVDPSGAERLRGGIDRAFSARDAALAETTKPAGGSWFAPFEAGPEYQPSVEVGRPFVGKGSGSWIADSPRMLFQLLEAFEQVGVREIATEYLGERPAISVNKGTLRRVDASAGTNWWHQDGAFLGEGIRALNVWLSLTHCGRDAPGMDVVPRRIEEIVETGSHGADFDWSVGEPVVEKVAPGAVTRPTFEPGDALLFDHLFLHRTGSDPEMTETRYATETWFFAPSAYPDPLKQVPLVY